MEPKTIKISIFRSHIITGIESRDAPVIWIETDIDRRVSIYLAYKDAKDVDDGKTKIVYVGKNLFNLLLEEAEILIKKYSEKIPIQSNKKSKLVKFILKNL